jgi:hypothetical protein
VSSRSADDDGIEALVAEPFERAGHDAFGDVARVERLIGIALVEILEDVAGVDDDNVAVDQCRHLEPGVELA